MVVVMDVPSVRDWTVRVAPDLAVLKYVPLSIGLGVIRKVDQNVAVLDSLLAFEVVVRGTPLASVLDGGIHPRRSKRYARGSQLDRHSGLVEPVRRG